MKFTTGLVAGAAIGYLVATRMDPETRRRIESKVNEQVAHLRDDPRVQEVVDSVSSVAGEVIDKIEDRAAT